LLIVKRKARLRHAESVDALDEPAPVGPAAKLAVSDDRKPDVLLQLDGIADRRILSGGKALFVQLAVGKGAEGSAQSGRAQQAANMIGAKRRTTHATLLDGIPL
jgi:hypothetical protein